jgi:iron complex outermembrane receptor protein
VGINDLNANSASSVAVYYDDIYMNSPAGQLAQMFDVESVEVLRGPQGSLYGRNASAGAIRVNSRRPTDELNASAQATYGNYDTLELQGALGLPILPELLSARAAFRFNRRDGVTENRCHGDDQCAKLVNFRGTAIPSPTDNPTDPNVAAFVNDRDNIAGRLLMRATPMGGDMDWLLNLHGSQNNSLATQFQHLGAGPQSPTTGLPCDSASPPPPRFAPCTDAPGSTYRDRDDDPYSGEYNRAGKEKLDTWGVSLNGTWALGNFDLTSITGYETNDREVDQNTDANPNQLLEILYLNDAWQVSQEIRLAWDAGNELRWIAGAYFLTETLNVDNDYISQPNNNVNTLRIQQQYEQRTFTYAFFGHFTWDVAEDLTFEGGVRWNWERKDFVIGVINQLPGRNSRLLEASETESWSAPTGDLSLSWRPTEDVTIYGKYSRGWKGGGFNGGALDPISLADPFQPESVDSFEVGLKSFWFDRRLMLNLTGFYYDYDDLQVFNLERARGGVPVQQLINANDAEVFGVELDLHSRPLDGLIDLDALDVRFNFGWLESRYKDFVDTFQKNVGRPSRLVELLIDYSGNRLVGSPNFSWSGAVEWELPLFQPDSARFGVLIPHYDFAYKDDVFFDPSEGRGVLQSFSDPFTIGQEAYWLHNFRLTYREPNGRWEIAGWVRNAFDQTYKVDAFDVSEGFDLIIHVIGEPRTFGATVTFNF